MHPNKHTGKARTYIVLRVQLLNWVFVITCERICTPINLLHTYSFCAAQVFYDSGYSGKDALEPSSVEQNPHQEYSHVLILKVLMCYLQ